MHKVKVSQMSAQ